MPSGTFVAIDFETSGRQASSACAAGLVRIREGRLEESFYTLIRPPSSRILFTWVHGLTWDMLKDAPSFPEIWPEMAAFIEGADGFVAHNAPFDRSVLYGCAEAFGCQAPAIPFHCTLKGSRRALPLQSRGLDCVCGYFGIGLDHHHALSDARACAEIFLRLQALGVTPADMRLSPPGRPRPKARLLKGPDAPAR